MAIFKIKKTWVIALVVIPATFAVVTLFQNCAPGTNQALVADENGMVSSMPMASNAESEKTSRTSATAKPVQVAAATENQMGGMIAPPAETRNECSYTWFSGQFSLQTSGGKNGLPICSEATAFATHRFNYMIGGAQPIAVSSGELVCVPPASNCNKAAPASLYRPISIVFNKGSQKVTSALFEVNETFFAMVRGIDGAVAKDLASCMEFVGEQNDCNDATKYVEFPNDLWYNYGTFWGLRNTKIPAHYAGKTIRIYVMNKATGVRSAPSEMKVASGPGIVPPIACGWTGGGFVAGPCSANTKVCNTSTPKGTTDTVQCASGPSTSTCVCK